ncbi:unnamed protein product [Camellia sinensis]
MMKLRHKTEHQIEAFPRSTEEERAGIRDEVDAKSLFSEFDNVQFSSVHLMEEGTPMGGGTQNGPKIQIVTSPQLVAPSCDLLSREARDQYLAICLPLDQAALKGDWKAANGVIEIFPTVIRSSITKGWETALHIAAAAKRIHFVEELVGLMNPEDLELQNSNENTALCFVVAAGTVRIAEVMINKNERLPMIHGSQGMTPLYMAALLGHSDMVWYLYQKTKSEDLSDEDRIGILNTCVSTDLYDVALDILKHHPQLAVARDGNGETALHVLARKPLAFTGGSRVSMWKRFITTCRKVGHDKSLKQAQASELVRLLWKMIGSIKDLITAYRDEDRNNMLHLAPRIAPPNQLNIVSGAALQMQRELLWFKEVEKIMQPSYVEKKNSKGKTPRALCTEEHKNLVEKGEAWMKNTASHGEGYGFWSIRMMTLFKSQDLWDLVEQGYADPDEETRLKENKKKDSKALVIIQQAVHDSIFSRIAAATTSKQAWSTLQKEFQGDSKVIVVKLQSLRRDFETLYMKNGESIADFLSRVMTIVSQMRSYGEKISDETVVAKVLRSLTPKFDHVVAAIEESKDLPVFSFDELMGSLQAHETRINRSLEKNEEKAFQMKDIVTKAAEGDSSTSRGRGRGGFRGRGRGRGRGYGHGNGRGRGRFDGQQQSGEQRNYKNGVQCYHCKRYGHIKADCWYKDQQVNYVAENEESSKLFMTHFDPNNTSSDVWFIDSGCSNHMTGMKSLIKELDETQKLKVQLGNAKEMQVEGKGTVSIKTTHGNIKLLHNVQFVPDLGYNLLSVGQLMVAGYSISFDNDACVIRDKHSGHTLININMTQNKMFPLEVSGMENFVFAASGKDDSKLWHLRYGHLNIKGLKLLKEKGMVFGLPKIGSIELCEGCIYGKQTRKSFPVGKARRASTCLELIHADLCGPMQTKSFGGSRYFLLFTDDYSRMSWVYFLENKSEAFEKFKHFKAKVEKQSGFCVKVLRTDRGGEFLSKDFDLFCEENGIQRELTTPYTPEQNGVAERKNRTVVEMARSMLQAKGLSNGFWAEAVATSVYLLNLSPTRAVMNRTPVEAWRGTKPSVSHLRVFGCIAYALFLIRRDVVFDENASWDWRGSDEKMQQQVPMSIGISPNESQVPIPTSSSGSSMTSPSSPRRDFSPTLEESSDETPPRKFRSLRDIYESCQFALTVLDPMTYGEAATKEEWQRAMVEELAAIEKNKTWEMMDLPEGKNAIGLKWVFKTKFGADGSIQKHKARLVAKGYAQQYGIDFKETFSPEVYVTQPEGFMIEGKETKVYKLRKALYGLKQAPRAWYSKIDGYFQQNGFLRSENEPTLYVKKEGKNDFIIICLYVDDIIYTSSSSSLVAEFKSRMMHEFEMSDMGLLHYFLGLEVQQAEDGIFISQRKYAKDLLNKFGMLNCKPATTPMNINEKLQCEDGAEMADASRFRSLVGGLIHLTHTRPDIAFSVGMISRFMQHPSKLHFGAAKRVLRYIAGTMDYGIWYAKVFNFKLCGFTDSDWASSLDDRRSISANVFTLGSGVITWSSKKQATVALSSSEAEYVAATSAACQAIWLRRMLAELQQRQEGATEIFCDNKATIFMTKNPAFHSRTKHIDMRLHFIRDLVAKEEVTLKYCTTHEQLADILTKGTFTVPGGNDNNTGIPMFRKHSSFMVFAISDAIALVISSTSILMFLSILTSRYAENDFVESLPFKLMIGLTTLFISITTMMVAFGVTFFIVFDRYTVWVPIAVALFACVPIILFATLQYPLLADVIHSTYGSRLLFQPRKHMLY